MKLNVAVIQMEIEDGNKGKNITKALILVILFLTFENPLSLQ